MDRSAEKLNPAFRRRDFLSLTAAATAAISSRQTAYAETPVDPIEIYLGRGLDIFQSNPFEATTKLRAIASLPAVDRLSVGTLAAQSEYAENFLKLTHQVAIDAGVSGSYGNFSASVSTHLKLAQTDQYRSKFYKIVQTVITGHYIISGGTPALIGSISSDFVHAVNNMSPEEVFAQYGTHIIQKFKLGGKAIFVSKLDESEHFEEREFELAAKAAYSSLRSSVEANVSYKETNTRLKNLIDEGSSVFVVGGSYASASKISSKTATQTDWGDWNASVAENPKLIGFPEGGLTPIWDLCKNADTKLRLREAYRRKCARSFETKIIHAVSANEEHPEQSIGVPDGYKLLSGGSADIYSGEGNLLVSSFPEGPGRTTNVWRASGKSHVKDSPANMVVYAIAIYDPDNIWDVQTFQSQPNSGRSLSAQVNVPPEFTMVGGGARVTSNGEGNLLTASYPSGPQTWRAAAKDHIKVSEGTITAYAVGLRSKVSGVVLSADIAVSESNPSNRPAASAKRASEHRLTGGGASISYRGEGILLTSSYPSSTEVWSASGKDHVGGDTGTLTAYCLSLIVTEG